MRSQKGRAGFTLIELLVVISIIAVLAGLVMTATMKVRQQSRKVQCSNNLRQLGIASMMYLNQYRIFPFNYGGEVSENGDDPFDDEEEAVKKGFEHIQLLFDTQMLDDAEVAVCGASTDVIASEDEDGNFTLKRHNCSYCWTRKPRTDGDKTTLPLSADKAQKDGPGENNHPGGRNVLYLGGNVKWRTAKELEKGKVLEKLTDE